MQFIAPPSALPTAAHLGAGLGDPDLMGLVVQPVDGPADDAFPVHRQRDRHHRARMPRHGALRVLVEIPVFVKGADAAA